MEFIQNPMFVVMFIQYLQNTKMKRIHKRSVFNKSIKNYYVVLENMINESKYK